ncbi:MAG: FHA domain-containing protein [Cyanobacteriota/Melainabacteria group bacterium]
MADKVVSRPEKSEAADVPARESVGANHKLTADAFPGPAATDKKDEVKTGTETGIGTGTETRVDDKSDRLTEKAPGEEASDSLRRLIKERQPDGSEAVPDKLTSGLMSQEETRARNLLGRLSGAARVKSPEQGLLNQEVTEDGGTITNYDRSQRTDGLKESGRRMVEGGVELFRNYEGRVDGLQEDRLRLTAGLAESEQRFEPGKREDGKVKSTLVLSDDGKINLEFNEYSPEHRKDGLIQEATSREDGNITRTSRVFGENAEGLKTETVTVSGEGIQTKRGFTDGTSEVTLRSADGTLTESKRFDARGKEIEAEKEKAGTDSSAENRDTSVSLSVDRIARVLARSGTATGSIRDADAVGRELEGKSPEELKQINELFKTRHGEGKVDLDTRLEEKFRGADSDYTRALLRGENDDSTHVRRLLARNAESLSTGSGPDKDAQNKLVDTIKTKSSEEIATIDKTYRERHGTGLKEALLDNGTITDRNKQFLEVYLKGSDKRSPEDVKALADRTVADRDLDGFKTVFADGAVDDATRKDYLKDGGEEKVRNAFGKDGKLALDYAREGSLQADTAVELNSSWLGDNEAAIDKFLKDLPERKRQDYKVGKRFESESEEEPERVPTEAEIDPLLYYAKTHGALDKSAGYSLIGSDNAKFRDLARWEDQISNPGGSLITRLTKHGGSVYNDGVDKVLDTVEGIDAKDWKQLKTDPEYRSTVDQFLDRHYSKADADRVKDVLDRKSGADTFEASKGERRPALDNIKDHRGDLPGTLDALTKLTKDEQRRYREDPDYKQDLDKAVSGSIRSNHGRAAAREILDGVSRGEAPERGIISRIHEHNIPGKPDRAGIIRDVEAAFKKDPGLKDRISEPKTEEDRAFSEKFKTTLETALGKRAFQSYGKELISDGSLSLESRVKLYSADRSKNGFFESLSGASKSDLERIKTDSASALPGFSKDQRRVAEVIADQGGKIEPADRGRIAVLDGDRQALNGLFSDQKPGQGAKLEEAYAKKYGADLREDGRRLLSTEEFKKVDRDLREPPKDAAEAFRRAQEDRYEGLGGIGRTLVDNLWDGTGHQAVDDYLRFQKGITEYSKDLKELPPEQFNKLDKSLQESLKLYRESKTAAADAVVDGIVITAGVGGAAFTGGVSLSLLSTTGLAGAALKVGLKSGIEGKDYDWSLGNVLKDGAIGTIDGATSVLGPAQFALLKGLGGASAELAARGILGQADEIAKLSGTALLKTGSEETLKKGLGDTLAVAIANGQREISASTIQKLAEEVGTSPEAAKVVSELIQRSLSEAIKVESGNLLKSVGREAALNSKAGLASGTSTGVVYGADEWDGSKSLEENIRNFGTRVGSQALLNSTIAGVSAPAIRTATGAVRETAGGVKSAYESGRDLLRKPRAEEGRLVEEAVAASPPSRLATADAPDKAARPVEVEVKGSSADRVRGPHEPEPVKVSGASKEFSGEIQKLVDELPDELKRYAADGKVEILAAGKITDVFKKADGTPDWDRINQQPRGYLKGDTFENVPAFYDPNQNRIVLVENYKARGSDRFVKHDPEFAKKTVVHELGHVVDKVLGYPSLNNPDFQRAVVKDLKHIGQLKAGRDLADNARPVSPEEGGGYKVSKSTLDNGLLGRVERLDVLSADELKLLKTEGRLSDSTYSKLGKITVNLDDISYYLSDKGAVLKHFGIDGHGRQKDNPTFHDQSGIRVLDGGRHADARSELFAELHAAIRGTGEDPVQFEKLFPNATDVVKKLVPDLELPRAAIDLGGITPERLGELGFRGEAQAGGLQKYWRKGSNFYFKEGKLTLAHSEKDATATVFAYDKDGALESIKVHGNRNDFTEYKRIPGVEGGEDRWLRTEASGRETELDGIKFEVNTDGRLQVLRQGENLASDAGARFPALQSAGDSFSVGRNFQNIANLKVSREHASVVRDQRGVFIQNQSVNGTTVVRDGKSYLLQKGDRAYLKQGDEVYLGGVEDGYRLIGKEDSTIGDWLAAGSAKVEPGSQLPGLNRLPVGSEFPIGRQYQDIDSKYVSRNHAALGRDDEGAYIVSKSAAPTFIVSEGADGGRNVRRLNEGEKHRISAGEEIWLGSAEPGVGHKLDLEKVELRESPRSRKEIKERVSVEGAPVKEPEEASRKLFGEIDIEGPGAIRTGDSVTIGSDLNSFPKDNPLISSKHVVVGNDGFGVYLRDVSEHGTYIVNDKVVQRLEKGTKYHLREGDQVLLGSPDSNKGYRLDFQARVKDVPVPTGELPAGVGKSVELKEIIPADTTRDTNKVSEIHRIEYDGKTQDFVRFHTKDGGKRFKPDTWLYGKGGDSSKASPVKLHIGLSDSSDPAKDLKAVQDVIIPLLRDQLGEDVLSWKTLHPLLAEGADFNKLNSANISPFTQPSTSGQGQKGFALFFESAEKAREVAQKIDAALVDAGLALKKAPESGNVDKILAGSKRVGIVRDRWEPTSFLKPDSGESAPAVVLDKEIASRLNSEFGLSGLSPSAREGKLREIEDDLNIGRGLLVYDDQGRLSLAIKPVDKKGYVAELKADAEGRQNNRRAIYAIADRYGIDPASLL